MRIIRAGEHIQHIPGYGISVRESGVAVATSNWWVVAGKTCVAAYQPKGAASLAASYVNLVNPGTNNAAPGVAPDWDSINGWDFNGTDDYLNTGITPDNDQAWSFVVRHGASEDDLSSLLGTQSANASPNNPLIYIVPRGSNDRRWAYGANTQTVSRKINAGTMSLLGAQGYDNGTAIGAASAPVTGVFTHPIWMGCYNLKGAPNWFHNGTIQAIAIYSDTLSQTEHTALLVRMNAL